MECPDCNKKFFENKSFDIIRCMQCNDILGCVQCIGCLDCQDGLIKCVEDCHQRTCILCDRRDDAEALLALGIKK